MLKPRDIPIDEIYVPVRRRKTLDPAKADELAEDILENGQKVPIQVRRDKKWEFVVVNGAHRIEAVKLLGEDTIEAFIVGEGKF